MAKRKVLGIDFGTCFSFPAIFVNDKPYSLLPANINNGNQGMPSVFYYNKKYGEMVGTRAETYGEREPEYVVKNIKLYLGNHNTFILDDKTYSSLEICSRILHKIVSIANSQLENDFREQPSSEIIIAVPVKFGDIERSLLREAAGIPRINGGTGIIVNNFIQEPVAAAIDYGELIKTADNILVYDLGGGTFDIALVKPTPNSDYPYTVLDFAGEKIGGNDFDEEFCTYLAKKFKIQWDIDLLKEKKWRNILLKEAKKAKEELSEYIDTIVEIQYDGFFYNLNVSRDEFEEITKPLLNKTILITKTLAKRNNLIGSKHLHVILVGGSSYMPQVRKALVGVFGENVRIHLHLPDKAIAFGAARFANNESTVLQLSPFSYGVSVTKDDIDKIYNILFIKTPLPTNTCEHTFHTRFDDQTYVRFTVCQNEKTDSIISPDKGKEIMYVDLVFPHKVEKHTEVIAQLSLAKDGTLIITAINPKTQEKFTNTINIQRLT